MADLQALASAIGGNEIHTLLVLGGNPVATAPTRLALDSILERQLAKPRKDWLAVHLGQTFDETARLCHWHIPETHFLEQWGDGVAFDGTASIVQPLIAPLYGAKSAHEIIAGLTPLTDSAADYDSRSAMELVQATWRARHPEGFSTFWQQSLHDGVVAETKWPAISPTLRAGLMADAAMRPAPAPAKGYELAIAPDPFVLDGRFANNGWLQETPRPITRLTWDNALMMSPATAKALGVATHVGGYKGGERGETIADLVGLKAGGGTLDRVAVWVVPGHADGAFTLHTGYGRTRAGKVGTGIGFDANRLRDTRAAWFLTGVSATRLAGKTYQMACLQGHYTMDGRDIVRSGTAAQYKAEPNFVTKHDHSPGVPHDASGKDKRMALPTLLPVDEYTGYKWGMAIDMTACTGCGACVVACQSENNVPVVGKEETTRGRQMQWLRIDRYFETTGTGQPGAAEPEDELRVHFMPLMCQHCEKAPCEIVCPVEATVHGDEGTNDMVYNRCVGTRYCSNNCPYKVRRFNFLQYSDYHTPSLKLAYNPDVTVRSRGVMEKCTFCIQRVAYARIESAKELLDEQDYEASHGKPWPADRSRKDPNGRKDQGKDVAYIRDGEVTSACQAACPAGAIVFGDLNDAKSRVHAMHESDLRYDLLGELGTRPRVGYLADLRNPNPALEAK
jgi:molybdopterin-containing oxidoreductase family iron-sulfur binding subunit